MRRTVTHDLALSGHDFHEGDKVVMFYGAANRDPRPSSTIRSASTSVGTRTHTSASVARARTSASVRTWLAASCRSCSVSS